ncbi:O-methyltransferase [Williamsia sterculiae]|uniref:Predicted O-methyltransferase YrrM n=1 Tax=Williamsia sterculiae TaxID=1344003 RepID=A0A1N7E0K1_9NOCA|nr:O-methyltransferase [Williamsia sterculiae]SIR81600.1 Predicted O-methyltransferase YrrM [Williamsia sterculiae]
MSDPSHDQFPDPRSLAAYAESAIVEDDILLGARERAVELGAPTISPAVGAALSLFATLTNAKAVVEIGTGAGLSGMWLLGGMTPEGILTTIDVEAEHHRAARQGFVAAGIAPSRTRLINGRAAEVLPRLADESYDLIFVNGAIIDQPRYVGEGVRLLRPGGVLVVHNAAADGRIADPERTDPDTVAAREAAVAISEDESLTPVVIPLGSGLLVAAKRR